MPNDRPSIPTKVRDAIFREAGNRCAVDGETAGLEIAHIVPWAESKSHKVSNLILLCALCHARADREGWGAKTLRYYKRNPWVWKRQQRSRRLVTLHIRNVDIGDFGHQALATLIFALSFLLRIQASDIDYEDSEEGSLLVTLSMPEAAADKLQRMIDNDDARLTPILDGKFLKMSGRVAGLWGLRRFYRRMSYKWGGMVGEWQASDNNLKSCIGYLLPPSLGLWWMLSGMACAFLGAGWVVTHWSLIPWAVLRRMLGTIAILGCIEVSFWVAWRIMLKLADEDIASAKHRDRKRPEASLWMRNLTSRLTSRSNFLKVWVVQGCCCILLLILSIWTSAMASVDPQFSVASSAGLLPAQHPEIFDGLIVALYKNGKVVGSGVLQQGSKTIRPIEQRVPTGELSYIAYKVTPQGTYWSEGFVHLDKAHPTISFHYPEYLAPNSSYQPLMFFLGLSEIMPTSAHDIQITAHDLVESGKVTADADDLVILEGRSSSEPYWPNSARNNLDLSRERAQGVADMLSKIVPSRQFHIVPLSSMSPIGDNTQHEIERSVTVRVLKRIPWNP